MHNNMSYYGDKDDNYDVNYNDKEENYNGKEDNYNGKEDKVTF